MKHDMPAPGGVLGWKMFVLISAACACLAGARAEKAPKQQPDAPGQSSECFACALTEKARKPSATTVTTAPPKDVAAERKLSVYTPADIVWKDAPAVLPAGAKAAILEGDPGKEGPFVIRLKVPAGFRIAPHTHSTIERVTVISGTAKLGFGAKLDPSVAKTLPAGSYVYFSQGMEHFAIFDEDTVIQLHGLGPWDLVYLDPADDPTNNKPAAK